MAGYAANEQTEQKNRGYDRLTATEFIIAKEKELVNDEKRVLSEKTKQIKQPEK